MARQRSKWTGRLGALRGRRLQTAVRTAEAARFLDQALPALEPDASVLDLGAGTGLQALAVAQRLSGGRVVAVDLSQSMLDQLARLAMGRGLTDRLELRCCPADETGLADGCMDYVISVALLHEVPDPAAVLAEAWRVLRPGGRVAVRDFAYDARRSWLAKLTHPRSAYGHLRPGELRAGLEAAGFEALELRRSGRQLDAFCIKPG
jgi:ubiquinone/menaquinone biosynthesis C-methylase UbiE